MKRYELDYLSEKFGKHAEEAKKNNAKAIEQFKQMNPKEPLPEWMTEEFCLPVALKSIVDEIIQMKKQNV